MTSVVLWPRSPARSGARTSAAATARAVATVGGVLVLWFWGLQTTHADRFSVSGVIGQLSAPYMYAVAAVATMIGVEICRPVLRPRMLAAAAALLVLVLFSLPNLALSHASQPTAYLHVGFAQYIAEHGAVPRHYDARFAWPGFFAGLASIVSAAGLGNAEPLLKAAPIFFELLLIAPLRVIALRLLRDERGAWLAVFLFFLGVWFEQDYLSPQAVGLVLYLVIVALALAPTPATGPILRRWRQPPSDPRGTRVGLGVYAVLIGLLATLVPTHQLTPTAVIIALGLMALLGATPYRRLWLVAGLIFLIWFSFGAKDYWSGHLSAVFGSIGKVSSTLNAGVGAHVHGDRIYSDVQLFRLALSAAFVLTGVVAAVALRRRQNWLLAVGLAFLPFSLVAAQDYGGEVVIRTMLYAMPGLAVLAAGLLLPLLRHPRYAAPFVAVLMFVGGIGLIAARGANVSFEQVTTGQLDAAAYVYQHVPVHGHVATYEAFTPLGLYSTKRFSVDTVDEHGACETSYVSCVPASANMVYLTTSQEAYGRLKLGRPAGWLMTTASTELLDSGSWKLDFRTDDAEVLSRVS